jgi:peptide-methionine (S)-S-oxide reductase
VLLRSRAARTLEPAGDARPFYYAEDYHQQYLAKNPDGYCGLGGCGIKANF